jgi:hypothetical protein
MKKIFIGCSFLFYFVSAFSQSFEIKQITSGDFDAKNPFISNFSFGDIPLIYFEIHKADSSNIAVIGYDPETNNFQDVNQLTTGNAMRINLYEDFNHNLIFQTNENGNWDIAFIPYENGNWGQITFLTNSPEDEFNLSPFYANEPFYPMINYVLFQRSDTIYALEYDESVITEYPVFINTPQYYYSDYIGIYCFNAPNVYPRAGIHIIAVETDSSGNQDLVYKYKPLNGQWEEKSFIKENCNCSKPSLQFYSFLPYLLFEDSTSDGIRPFSVYDWDYEKNIQPVPDLLSGNISDFKVDRPDLITLNSSPDIELEYFPHSYFVKDEDNLKIRLNKMESGFIVGDTLIDLNTNQSRITLGALGLSDGEVFYTIWEDSTAGRVHLFGRRQLYPISDVSDEDGIDGFLLNQNYPNPFNPTTTLSFVIGHRSFVTLKVYDVLGNEIATLVNEEKAAGEYEVTFDSHSGEVRNLVSGIYFYQLKAGNFIQTKKMILLK